nr:hypothetical protein [Tanacetum cinerariifolium]
MTLEAVRAMIDQAIQKNSTNGDGSHSSGGGPTRFVQYVRACSYSDFMKCQPLNFRRTEGVVGLSRWFEKMESELALMCTKFVADEKEKVDKYIGGLPDNINGNVMSTRPKTLDEAIELANDLMDQKLRTYLERQTESKRKCDNNNQAQQIPKRQNVAQAYAIGTGKRKEYAGTLLLCNKCKFHHNGPCTTKCANCKKVGHLTRDCWNPTATSNQKTITSYEGGNEGHYKSDCL